MVMDHAVSPVNGSSSGPHCLSRDSNVQRCERQEGHFHGAQMLRRGCPALAAWAWACPVSSNQEDF